MIIIKWLLLIYLLKSFRKKDNRISHNYAMPHAAFHPHRLK